MEWSFCLDWTASREWLKATMFLLRSKSRVLLLLARRVSMAVEILAYSSWPEAVMHLAAFRRPVSPDDFRLRHKTTDRSLYADVLKRGGTFEVLMIDQQGFLTEGC